MIEKKSLDAFTFLRSYVYVERLFAAFNFCVIACVCVRKFFAAFSLPVYA